MYDWCAYDQFFVHMYIESAYVCMYACTICMYVCMYAMKRLISVYDPCARLYAHKHAGMLTYVFACIHMCTEAVNRHVPNIRQNLTNRLTRIDQNLTNRLTRQHVTRLTRQHVTRLTRQHVTRLPRQHVTRLTRQHVTRLTRQHVTRLTRQHVTASLWSGDASIHILSCMHA
jgi:hypothetical protein